MNEASDVKRIVQEKYGRAAQRVKNGRTGGCCGAAERSSCCDPVTSNLYDAAQAKDLPPAALEASLGCGNPTALAQLEPGETVLDLGSGGGIDVLLSARRVGPTGNAYGLGMTDDTPLAVMYRMARGARIYDGADEVHKMVVARRILRSFEDGGVWRFT